MNLRKQILNNQITINSLYHLKKHQMKKSTFSIIKILQNNSLRVKLYNKFTRLVLNNSLFNEEYYKYHYSDSLKQDVNLLLHYYEEGWKEGKNPCVDFDTNAYLLNNPDVKIAGVNPLLHYLFHGKEEGREKYQVEEVYRNSAKDIENIKKLREGGIFDEEYYLKTYPEVKLAGEDAATHYYYTGYKENKSPCPNFNFEFYSS